MIERTFLSQSLSDYKKALEDFKPIFNFHMFVIIEEILRKVKPISIYLIGSFGRGEGSLYVNGEDVHPFRDYDVLLIVDRHVKSEVIASIRRDIHQRLGLQDPFSREFKFKGFTVWITQATLKEINAMPLLKFYELKEASTLLWGDDVRPNISLSFDSLSPYSGVLALFSKIEGLLGLLDPKVMMGERSSEMLDLIYECMKTYTEIGTCLGLISKVYAPRFLIRCSNISRDFEEQFPDLLCVNEELPSLISKCARDRLMISEGCLNNLDPCEFLRTTLKDLKIAIWYFLHKAYNVDTEPLTEYNTDEYLRKFDTKVLEDFFGYFVKTKLGFCPSLLRKLAVQLYFRYASIRFFMKGRREGKPIKVGVLFYRKGNIMMRLWLTGLVLLSSIKDGFEIDEELLSLAEKRLKAVIGSEILECSSEKDSISKFLCLRKVTLDLLDLADRVFHRKD